MKPSQDRPLQQQMLVMTLLICGAVLCVAIAALFTFQVVNFRSNFQLDATTLAAVIANNSTAALTFDDAKVAKEVVDSLTNKATVVSACLVRNGSPFVYYGNADYTNALSQFPSAQGYLFSRGHLLVTQPIKCGVDQAGTLYLRLHYQRTLLELLGLYGLVVVSIIIVSIGLAAFLSRRLGSKITHPILHLARIAQVVGEKKDYSVRAVVSSRGDELGRLMESFNEMLSRIESQDAALSLSQQKMEALINSIDGIVWERTPDRTRFTFISRQSKDILGYEPQVWLDTPNFWEEKLQPQDAAKAVQAGHDLAARRQPYRYEYRMIAADGRTVWIRESGTVLVEKGQPVAMRGIFQDV